eukprot:4334455-Pyramimonas_sp.AAC.1
MVSTWFCHATILYLFEHDFTGDKLQDFRDEINECFEKEESKCKWQTLDTCEDKDAVEECNGDLP